MKGRIVLTVGLAVGLALLVLAGLSGQPGRAQASCDRYVQGLDGVDVGDCSDEENPCKSIQYAIDQSNPGDVVCVANAGGGPLTYAETLVIHESITLNGAWEADCAGAPLQCAFNAIPCDASNVVIDAGGAGRVISISGSIAPTIDCFTITGGDAAGTSGNGYGGGISSQDAAPIIVNNVISGNYNCSGCPPVDGRGGGIYLSNAPATAVISGNLIAHNVADDCGTGQGGGIMLMSSNAQVLSNSIEYNRAGFLGGEGGGIRIVDGRPLIAGNTIEWNVAGQGVAAHGGGISIWSGGMVTIERNTISANDAIRLLSTSSLTSTGGGIHVVGNPTVTAIIRDNTLAANWASNNGPPAGYGGGMYLSNLRLPSEVSGNYVLANRGANHHDGAGGGIYVNDSQAYLRDNYLSGNMAAYSGTIGMGGAIYLNGGAMFVQENDLFWNYGVKNEAATAGAGYGGGLAAAGGAALVTENTIMGNYATLAEGTGYGGGIYLAGGSIYTVDSNVITGNIASANGAVAAEGLNGAGGGIAISGTAAILSSNTIAFNVACTDTCSAEGDGGGIIAIESASRVDGNYIHHNTAASSDYGYGGGVMVSGGSTQLDRNIVLDNVATVGADARGGGFLLMNYVVFSATNNIVARNHGTGSFLLYYGSRGALAHNTLAENLGGAGAGIFVGSNSHVTLTNNIIISQTTGINNADVGVSTVSATHTLFEANGTDYSAGVTSSSEIPGPAALLANYHLSGGSNAIDQAAPIAWVSRDIDNDPRPVGAAPDVGADEHALKAYLPLVLRDY